VDPSADLDRKGPPDIMEHVDPIFYGDPKTAAMKVLGGA
jgi:hypothetical protein